MRGRPFKDNADWFRHEIGMRNDRKIRAVRSKFGIEGYAVYNMLLETISEEDLLQYRNGAIEIDILAGDFGIDAERLRGILQYLSLPAINLIQIEDGYIRCEQLERRLRLVFDKRGRNLDELRRINSPENTINSPENTIKSPEMAFTEALRVEQSREEHIAENQKIDEVYQEYPSKCPVKHRSTAKCDNDRKKIGRLIKAGKPVLEIMRAYLADCKKTQTPIRNLQTFLNNLPEDLIENPRVESPPKHEWRELNVLDFVPLEARS